MTAVVPDIGGTASIGLGGFGCRCQVRLGNADAGHSYGTMIKP